MISAPCAITCCSIQHNIPQKRGGPPSAPLPPPPSGGVGTPLHQLVSVDVSGTTFTRMAEQRRWVGGGTCRRREEERKEGRSGSRLSGRTTSTSNPFTEDTNPFSDDDNR